MDDGSKTINLLLPIIILVFLVIAAGVVVYVITSTGDSQAPEDTSAATAVGYVNPETGQAYATGGDATCGESCSTTSDCILQTNYGVPVVCSGGKCKNSLCPSESTEGSDCSCSAKGSCGDRCGYGSPHGGCVSGSKCTYITGSSCSLTYSNTYCVPTTNSDVERVKCVSRDTSNSYLRLKSNPDKTSFTAAEVLALCSSTTASTSSTSGTTGTTGTNSTTCGNGVVDSGEQCDTALSTSGCSSGTTCNSSCLCVSTTTVSVSSLPKTGIIDRNVVKVAMPIFLIISGLFVIRLGKIESKNGGD